MRGSDPDAALYWMMRMIEAGEDPLFIARRMVIFAAEDIGNADPQALQVAVAAKDAVHFVGLTGRKNSAGPSGDLSRHRAEIERLLQSDARGRRKTSRNTARCRCRSTCATRRRH